jgi:hypothetical protein
MTKALAITSNSPLPLTSAERGGLSERQRTKLARDVAMCKAVAELLRTGAVKSKEMAFSKVWSDTGVGSFMSLKRKFNAWAKGGERALIDHAMCGTVSCGFPECGNRDRASLLPTEVLSYWVQLVASNTSLQRKGVRSQRWGYNELWSRLAKGEIIPGYGDWRRVWRDSHHGDERTPETCTMSAALPPRGWTFGNFLAQRDRVASLGEIEAAQRGLGQVIKSLPMVRRDWGALRIGEALFIDDWQPDIETWLEVDGVPQLVRAAALVMMDAATRRIVGFRLYPQFLRKDGTRQGIERRHVQHLIAHYLATVGVPRGYECELVCENATAAITDEFETILTRRFPNLNIRRQGLHIGDGGVISRIDHTASNSNAKSLIEGWFNRGNKELGHVRGQLGSNYLLKAADQEARERRGELVIRAVGSVLTESQLTTLMPLDHFEQTVQHIAAAVHRLETNSEHEMQGFRRVMKWRYGPGDSEWKSMAHEDLLSMREELGMDAVNKFLRGDGRSTTEMETVRERWASLYQAENFERLGPADFWSIWCDVATAKVSGDGTLTAKLSRGRSFEFHQFQGLRRLVTGEKIAVRFDADHPANGCALQDADGRVIGSMKLRERWQTADELNEQLGEKMAAEKTMLERLARAHGNGRLAAAELSAVKARVKTLEMVAEIALPPVADASAEAADLESEMDNQEVTRRASQKKASTAAEREAKAATARADFLAARKLQMQPV